MNFFEHQDQARRLSARLIALFALYVLVLLLAVNALAAWGYVRMQPVGSSSEVPWSVYGWATLFVLAVIGAGTAHKILALRSGGMAIAQMLGARPLNLATTDAAERQLLNVVEEMALASGLAVPQVVVLEQQGGINAFAAGHSPNDAVIAVTRGALGRLTRDELQGVIAHEFSHILNGDMALNLRLVGVLHGLLILAVAGRYLMESVHWSRAGARRGEGAVAMLFALGAALWLLGYLGVLIGRLIKASVSRQREYLADASAVQFTRNPDGIGGALRKIGNPEASVGSWVNHPQTEALSHMFMAPALRALASGVLATHPPLKERVRRIYGRTMPWLDAASLRQAPIQVPGPTRPARPGLTALDEPLPFTLTAPVIAAAAISPLAAMVKHPATPDQLVQTVGRAASLEAGRAALAATGVALPSSPTEASWMIYALLIDRTHAPGQAQVQWLSDNLEAEASTHIQSLHAQLQHLAPGARLLWVDRLMPQLHQLSQAQRTQLLEGTRALIAADGKVTLMEFLLYTVLKHRIGPEAGRAVPVRFKRLTELQKEVVLVLSLLATLRLPERPDHAYQAGLLLAPGLEQPRIATEAIALPAVNEALDRLNQLAPLVKPQFIRACAATATVDGATNWQAASCLRAICAAIDAPLPPMA